MDPVDYSAYLQSQLNFLRLLQDYLDQQIAKHRTLEKNNPDYFDSYPFEDTLNRYYNVLLRVQELSRSIRDLQKQLLQDN
jgi:hypothetical protein